MKVFAADPFALLLLLKTFALLLLLPKLVAKSISSAAAEAIYSVVVGSIYFAAAAEAICSATAGCIYFVAADPSTLLLSDPSALLLWSEPFAAVVRAI
ncbi:hypothetical protein SLEP1_g57821 [Rubroshorea leprosula]|uniref:Uncharacterized protein n=1 Tax=Rubroshorea leprosula TaxID=152421 RepID=A0AAV5MRX4_9ROSI|nr:hypothetical protein SLEP1_g57821 [Rubroshorea leprosula]